MKVICPGCGQPKIQEEDFHKDGISRSGKQKYKMLCKECRCKTSVRMKRTLGADAESMARNPDRPTVAQLRRKYQKVLKQIQYDELAADVDEMIK